MALLANIPIYAQLPSPFSSNTNGDTEKNEVAIEDLPTNDAKLERLQKTITEVEEAREVFRKKNAYPPQPDSDNALSVLKARLIYEIDGAFGEQLSMLNKHRDLINQPRTVDLSQINYQDKPLSELLKGESVTLEILDQLYVIRQSLNEQYQIITDELKRITPNLKLAEDRLKSAETLLANLKAGNTDAKQEHTKESAQLVKLAAEKKMELARQQSRCARLESENLKSKVQSISKVIDDSRQKFSIDPEIQQKRETDFNQLTSSLQSSLKQAQARLYDSEYKLQKVAAQNGDLELLKIQRDAAKEVVSLNQAWVRHYNLEYQFTSKRMGFYQGKLKRSEMIDLLEDVELELERIHSDLRYLKIQYLRAEERLEKSSSNLTGSSDDKKTPEYESYWEIADSIQQEIWSAQAVQSKLKILSDELQAETLTVSWRSVREQVVHKAENIWNHQLFIVNERPFNISSLFWVIILISIGLLVAGYVSRIAGRVLEKKTGAGQGASAAYEKLIFYSLVVITVVLAFKIFNFSLTSLTVVSGALALAVGFGSQEILKNFISGIILLIERPIHKGDLIQMDERVLRVESIGARSTRVRDLDHTQRIVPNSMLLENVITNWTLSDDVLRSEVTVGVAYGTDTRETSNYLVKATKESEGVLENPEPFAIFSGFGDNALNFSVYFWSQTTNRIKICSEVRHEISRVLTDADICISFPQRDVHLDTSSPLEITMNRAQKNQAPPPPSKEYKADTTDANSG